MRTNYLVCNIEVRISEQNTKQKGKFFHFYLYFRANYRLAVIDIVFRLSFIEIGAECISILRQFRFRFGFRSNNAVA